MITRAFTHATHTRALERAGAYSLWNREVEVLRIGS
jgi:hypothetical protein